MKNATLTTAQKTQLERLQAACEARKSLPKPARTDTDFDFEVHCPVVHSTETFELQGWSE